LLHFILDLIAVSSFFWVVHKFGKGVFLFAKHGQILQAAVFVSFVDVTISNAQISHYCIWPSNTLPDCLFGGFVCPDSIEGTSLGQPFSNDLKDFWLSKEDCCELFGPLYERPVSAYDGKDVAPRV